ncbi:MFS transporter [Sphaerisporangium rufum]|uniref:MFS transporter n=1 Tax=Sphaerisporangium rufum TaxID=1381558 RepID=A0A919UYB6_9ACTN|nr:MFS transporter [Sphaerisporangium rufum]GII76679.1 MFS transporter [Sphaerisporangium rufum]
MTDTLSTPDEARAAGGPAGEPPPVGPGFVAAYAAAHAGLWIAVLTPIVVTMAVRVQQLAGPDAAATQGLVLGTGAVLALVTNPVFGALSDRTTSRFGRRRPWVLAGALAGAAGLAVVAVAPGVGGLLAGWCLAQLGFNAMLAALTAVLADRVPARQRGTVSGAVGVTVPVALVCGTFLVQATAGSTAWMFLAPAALAVAGAVVFAAVLRERRPAPARPGGPRRPARRPWSGPWRHPDFTWAWVSRFLLFMGIALLATFQAFYLVDHLGRSIAEVPRLIFWSTLVTSAAVILAGLVAGRVSDLTGRRKIFVLVSALVYGAGLLVIAAAPSFGVFLAGAAITGLGQGVYLAVDLALVADVLPDRETGAARNMGVLNIATALPQSLAPAIAPVILAAAGGSYPVLFLVAGLLAMLGSAAIAPVRGVR